MYFILQVELSVFLALERSMPKLTKKSGKVSKALSTLLGEIGDITKRVISNDTKIINRARAKRSKK